VKKRWEDHLKTRNVLCWVGDAEDNLSTLKIITHYDESVSLPYRDMDYNIWTYATPETLENITQLIYECQPE
jgi:hypothetical protein